MKRLREYIDTRRKRRRIAKVFILLLVLFFIIRCGRDDTIEPPALIYIPTGTTATKIVSLLDLGIDISEDKIIEYFRNNSIRSGWVRYNPYVPITHKEFLDKLSNSQRERTRRVVMYSGETIHMFCEKLASQTLLPKGKLLNAYYRHSPYSDGGILAGYYDVPYRTTPDITMRYLTTITSDYFRQTAEKYGHSYDPKGFRHYLTIASIIQKETWHTSEMPLISSVIANRLAKGVKLQLDATLNYGPYAHTPVTPDRIRTDASRFNTYRHKGLPPEPIGSISKEALAAAIKPAQTKYIFFVRNNKGFHVFSETYAEHLKNIEAIKNRKEMIVTSRQNQVYKSGIDKQYSPSTSTKSK